MPAAAQAAVTPVLVLMSGDLSLIAVPANLLACPAVAPATILGFAAALVAPVWPDAAQWLVMPAGYAVGWIVSVARWAAQAPLTHLPWPGGMLGVALLAVAVVVAALVLRRPTWRRVVLVASGAALAAAVVVPPIAAPWPPPRWLLVACDVGQGDGLVIAAGSGRGVVVDTGPDPVAMDRCLRDLGVREVPLVVLTHPHADHIGGLRGVLRGRSVGAVVVSAAHQTHRAKGGWEYRSHGAQDGPVPPDGPGEGQAAPSGQASASGHERPGTAPHDGRQLPEWVATPGARWRFGPSELTVVAPSPSSVAAGPGEGSVLNNASIVLHVRWAAGSALLGGDIETEAQTDLVRQGMPKADVLKVPHHGSGRQDPEFLAAVGARAALISVGADNGYGHPAVDTLTALHRLGVRAHRTDRSGDLAIVERDGSLAVVSRGVREER